MAARVSVATRVRRLVQILALVCIMGLPLCTHQQADDYVDPTDMLNFDPANVKMKTSTKPSRSQAEGGVPPEETQPAPDKQVPSTQTPPISDKQGPPAQTSTPDKQIDSTYRQTQARLESFISLFSQYTNRLVHLLESKVSSASNPVEVNLRLRVSHHDLVKLRKFGEGGDRTDIHAVHETLSHMIMYASDVLEPETTIYWLERKLGVSSAVFTQVLSILVLLVVLAITFSRIRLTWSLVSWFFVLAFLVSVIFTWMELYQKEVAIQEKILSQDVRTQCPGLRQDLSWLESLTFYFKSTFTFQDEKCKDFYESMLVSPLVRTNPLQAISLAVVKTITVPLGTIATGIRQFFVNLLKDLPVQVQTLMIAIVVPFIGMAMLICSRYHVRILGILHIGPSNDVPQILQERPRGNSLTFQGQQQPQNQLQSLTSSRSESSIGYKKTTDQRRSLTKGHRSTPLLSHKEIREGFDDENDDVVKEVNEASDESMDGPTHDSINRLQRCSESKDQKNVMFKTFSSETTTQGMVETIEPVASKKVEPVNLAAKSHQLSSPDGANDLRQTDPTAMGSVVLEEQRLRLQHLTKTNAVSQSGYVSSNGDCVTHSGQVSTDSVFLTGAISTVVPPSLTESEMSASFEILASGLSSNFEGRAAE